MTSTARLPSFQSCCTLTGPGLQCLMVEHCYLVSCSSHNSNGIISQALLREDILRARATEKGKGDGLGQAILKRSLEESPSGRVGLQKGEQRPTMTGGDFDEEEDGEISSFPSWLGQAASIKRLGKLS